MKNHHIPMAWAHFAAAVALAGLLPGAVHAEDIDIYQGTAGGAAPNLLVILDNAAASDGNASYTCTATVPGGTTLLTQDSKTAGTNFGFERCGLYSAVSAIGTDTALNGKINLGLMYFPTSSSNGGAFVQPSPSPAPGALVTMNGTGAPGASGGLSQMLSTISGLSLTTNKSNNNQIAQAMQEAWAFYQGKTGLSGTTYPGLDSSQACAKNFVLYITLATNNQKPQDAGTRGGSALQSAEALSSLPAQLPLPNWKSPISNLLASGKYLSDYSNEWASFMHTGKSPNLTTNYPPITTYTIILSDGSNPDYEQLMVSMAQEGGGQYFVVKIGDMSGLVEALKRVFAEVQAVNSVFAAPVLPVSANTQGTYLNQIYMGMFRPDGTDAPRWTGNLKQYQFGTDISTGSTQLFLADASWGPYQAGRDANGALSGSNTGFISPAAVSFWSAKNTSKLPDNANTNGGFWLNSYQALGASNGFDAPDGQFVEKGGVGQQVRLQYLQDTYPASSAGTGTTARNVYTCMGSGCVSGTLLNTMKFNSANTNLTATALGNPSASAAWVNNLINWVRGEDTNQIAGDTAAGPEANKPPTATPPISIRGSAHGDVLHSRPVVINYGGTIGTVVFYGSNDGMFRAINGNQPPATNTSPQPMGNCTVSSTCAISMKDANGNTTPVPPGGELWSFVAQEFYPCLQQLYTNNVAITLGSTSINAKSCNTPQNPSGKPYFFDGAPGVYWNSSTGKAYLFLSARRGGRLLYALDVSDPTNPKYMWKISNATSGFSELGQTWSQPKVAMIKGYVETDSTGKPVLDSNGNVIPKPVLIFGGGYDTNQDGDPPASTDSMGRAIYVVDAVNGSLLWKATGGGSGTSCTTSAKTCQLAGMTSSIPADITLVDRDFDGLIDRLYAADTGGNLWRVDLQPDGSGAISTWKAYQFAALGGTGTSKRKFFFPPDVVLSKNYDVVVSVTGDREHPLASTTGANSVVNRFYMIKDTQVGPDGSSSWTAVHDDTASNANTPPPTSALFNATSVAYDGSANGFYISLSGSGEKGVNSPTTFGGQVYFGTNRPAGVNDAISNTPGMTCPANLGVASGYTVNFLTGTKTSTKFNGGGLVPSPVTGLVTVKVNGKDTLVPFIIGGGGSGVDGGSGLGAGRPKIPVTKTKRRTYWYPAQDR